MSVPICNCFHTKRANGGKIKSFDALIWGEPSYPGVRNSVAKKLESLGQPAVKISWF